MANIIFKTFLGYHRASEIGAELGYYFGIISTVNSSNKKTLRLLKNLQEKIIKFPNTNDPGVDLITTITEIRSKFRQICATLKINSKYPETNSNTF